MSDRPSTVRVLLPLVVLVFVLGAWLTPPDPLSQLLWAGAGLAVAVPVAVWFARRGHRRLDATVRDCWLFVAVTFGSLVLGTLFRPNPVRSTAETALLLAGSVLLAGWLAFAGGRERLRALAR